MKRRYSITIHPRFDVAFTDTPERVELMRKAGLEIDELCNTVPSWLPHWLVRPWCRLQDGWQWLRLF